MRRATVLCAGIGVAAMSLYAATVERMFRPERYSRGDTNVRVQQPIDEASWVWRAGCDQWGGAVFSDTRTDPKTLAKMPQQFLRFGRDFTASAEPLEFDVSADERFVLLLDGEEIARGPMRGLPNRMKSLPSCQSGCGSMHTRYPAFSSVREMMARPNDGWST